MFFSETDFLPRATPSKEKTSDPAPFYCRLQRSRGPRATTDGRSARAALPPAAAPGVAACAARGPAAGARPGAAGVRGHRAKVNFYYLRHSSMVPHYGIYLYGRV